MLAAEDRDHLDAVAPGQQPVGQEHQDSLGAAGAESGNHQQDFTVLIGHVHAAQPGAAVLHRG